MAAVTSTLSLELIRTDGGTQARVGLNTDTVADYAELYRSGKELPAVVVFHDGSEYWLGDGFHRVGGARQAGREDILAEIRPGSQRDAILYACGANQSHGLRRTNEDKRKAVERMLRDPEWVKWTDSRIAEHVGVDHKTVAAVRRDLGISQVAGTIGKPDSRIDRNGRTINTANIGKRTREAAASKPADRPAAGAPAASGATSKPATTAPPAPSVRWETFSPAELLDVLKARGFILAPAEDGVNIRVRPIPTEEAIRQAIRTHKPALLALLLSPPPKPAQPQEEPEDVGDTGDIEDPAEPEPVPDAVVDESGEDSDKPTACVTITEPERKAEVVRIKIISKGSDQNHANTETPALERVKQSYLALSDNGRAAFIRWLATPQAPNKPRER